MLKAFFSLVRIPTEMVGAWQREAEPQRSGCSGAMGALRLLGSQNPRLQPREWWEWLGKTYFAAKGMGLSPCVQLSIRIGMLTVSTSLSWAWLRPTYNRHLHDSI